MKIKVTFRNKIVFIAFFWNADEDDDGTKEYKSAVFIFRGAPAGQILPLDQAKEIDIDDRSKGMILFYLSIKCQTQKVILLFHTGGRPWTTGKYEFL